MKEIDLLLEHYTMTSLAKELETDRSNLYRYRDGDTTPRLKTYKKIQELIKKHRLTRKLNE